MIPFERLVVGPATDARLDIITFALALERAFVPLEGIPAKLNIPSRTPTEQRAKASKIRGLKIADWELDFFFMVGKKVFRLMLPNEFLALLLVVIETQLKNGCIES